MSLGQHLPEAADSDLGFAGPFGPDSLGETV